MVYYVSCSGGGTTVTATAAATTTTATTTTTAATTTNNKNMVVLSVVRLPTTLLSGHYPISTSLHMLTPLPHQHFPPHANPITPSALPSTC